MAPDAPSAPPPAGRSRPLWRHLLLGPTRLRAGWRVLLFILLVTGIGGLPLAVFGITWRDAFRWRFWEGSVWGFAAVAALVGMIALGGGYHVRGFALHGTELARMALLWLAAMTLVGISEEVTFRGYFLSTLGDGVGFWLAAGLTSLAFSLIHYFGKPMENLADALSVGLIGLFFCFTIRRTGNLWFAIGFHFAFDFAALSLFGAPNTGNRGRPVAGHLLDGTFSGPDWLTGGVRGAEASWLVFIVIAAMFVLFHMRHREAISDSTLVMGQPGGSRNPPGRRAIRDFTFDDTSALLVY